MNRTEFDTFLNEIYSRLDHLDRPTHTQSTERWEIDRDFRDSFMNGNSQGTIDQMRDFLHERRSEINQIEAALDAVIEEGEMGL